MKIKKPNICIIDDDRVYVNLISKIIQLRDLAQTIHIFKNGRDALNYFSSLKNVNAKIPDYVFLDVNMPIMDGWQFFEEYAKIDKALRSQMKLYIVSSSVNPRDIIKAKELPDVNGYLLKPLRVVKSEGILRPTILT